MYSKVRLLYLHQVEHEMRGLESEMSASLGSHVLHTLWNPESLI